MILFSRSTTTFRLSTNTRTKLLQSAYNRYRYPLPTFHHHQQIHNSNSRSYSMMSLQDDTVKTGHVAQQPELIQHFTQKQTQSPQQEKQQNDSTTITPSTTTKTIPPNITAGRQLYTSLSSPTKILAPMVDASELAWRIISRKYGAELAYTPMIHSRLFTTDPKYRLQHFGPQDGQPNLDRPLIVQFCANDPEVLVEAAKYVVGRCDAVDINLGCPQGIARKGHYGAFLMDEWELVGKLIRAVRDNVPEVPITAKIRVFDDWEKSLEYARMCLDSGAQFLCVHGRTRDMKGQKTGFANWKLVRYLRENLPQGTVFISNGNILYPDDVQRCLSEVGCDAVMSAEGNLCNPGVFWDKTDDVEKQFPRVDVFTREYFEVAKLCEGGESKRCFKGHLFKALKTFFEHFGDIRKDLGKINRNATWDEIENIVIMIEDAVKEIYQKDDIEELDVVKVGELEEWGGRYRDVPYWRLQPYFRKVDGVDGKDVIKVAMKDVKEKNLVQEQENKGKDGKEIVGGKRKADDDGIGAEGATKKVAV
ncbi:unnamed protein product [Ambrosiozyma monospora]|uniref:tRNA-dihydrouridine(16/17) synthase [NAD(P)(+)] n=1 Tax=Ambrosiozyma monospora TaxID=43982 RepID=A0A9W7DJ67_AMBMO|nr:unnamed protein product [Ambrosiozyma monospora]